MYSSIMIYNSIEAKFIYVFFSFAYYIYFSKNNIYFIYENIMHNIINTTYSIPYLLLIITNYYNFYYLLMIYNKYTKYNDTETTNNITRDIHKYKIAINITRKRNFYLFIGYYFCVQFFCNNYEVNKYCSMLINSFYCCLLNNIVVLIINNFTLGRGYIHEYYETELTYEYIDISNNVEHNNNYLNQNNRINTNEEFQTLIKQEYIYKNIKITKNIMCPICFESINQSSAIKTNCGHFFHNDCVKTWFKKSLCCPLCRNEFFLSYNKI